MSLLGDVVGGVIKFGFAAGKALVGAAINEAQKGQNIRMNARNLSDQDLINGFRNTKNSPGERTGYLQALKDRHEK